MPSGLTNNFPKSGRGLGHVTPTIFGSTVGYPSYSLASCSTVALYHITSSCRLIPTPRARVGWRSGHLRVVVRKLLLMSLVCCCQLLSLTPEDIFCAR